MIFESLKGSDDVASPVKVLVLIAGVQSRPLMGFDG